MRLGGVRCRRVRGRYGPGLASRSDELAEDAAQQLGEVRRHKTQGVWLERSGTHRVEAIGTFDEKQAVRIADRESANLARNVVNVVHLDNQPGGPDANIKPTLMLKLEVRSRLYSAEVGLGSP